MFTRPDINTVWKVRSSFSLSSIEDQISSFIVGKNGEYVLSLSLSLFSFLFIEKILARSLLKGFFRTQQTHNREQRTRERKRERERERGFQKSKRWSAELQRSLLFTRKRVFRVLTFRAAISRLTHSPQPTHVLRRFNYLGKYVLQGIRENTNLHNVSSK